MFQNGDYIVYGSKGIHKILNTTTLDIEGIAKDRLYYVMQPCAKPDSSVYAPVDVEKNGMRLVMSKTEAEDFLRGIDTIEPLDIPNNKEREEAYKKCIRSCSPEQLMSVIKALYLKKMSRGEQGKKLTLTDSHYMQQAEDILYEELSMSLNIPKESMPDHIQSFLSAEKADEIANEISNEIADEMPV